MITRYLPLTLTLDAPLLFDSEQSYISGGALRGAVVRGFCLRGLDRSQPDDFRRLIFSGLIRYLNAYPAITARRGLPLAESLGLNYEFATADADELIGVNVATIERTQQKRSLLALAADQEFHGYVLLSGADEAALECDAGLLKDALGETILLGRSRKSGYGGMARVAWQPFREREADGGRVLMSDQPAEASLNVLLTADYVGRDRNTGQIDPSALGFELRHRLGDRLTIVDRRQEFRTVGGYNRIWSLDLPRGLALQAGSILTAKLTQPIALADLLAVEHSGLGERRTEGFGRVLFLKPLEQAATPRPAESPSVSKPEGSPPPFLQTLQRRLLEDVIEERITAVAKRLTSSAVEVPSRQLLAQLRVPLRRPPREALSEMQAWLDGVRRPTWRALEACRLGDGSRQQPLTRWLRDVAGSEGHVPSLLGYEELTRTHSFTDADGVRSTLDHPAFENRVRLKLLDAVLSALSCRSSTEGDS
jgi:CRISPR-associated protein Csx10